MYIVRTYSVRADPLSRSAKTKVEHPGGNSSPSIVFMQPAISSYKSVKVVFGCIRAVFMTEFTIPASPGTK